jgi:basic membrane protein A
MITQVKDGKAIDTDWAGDLSNGAVALTELGTAVAAGTAEKLADVKAKVIAGEIEVFDTANFTVHGAKLVTYTADVDTDAAYTPDTEVIANGIFQESKFRSGPYFDLRIDGITLLDEAYG